MLGKSKMTMHAISLYNLHSLLLALEINKQELKVEKTMVEEEEKIYIYIGYIATVNIH